MEKKQEIENLLVLSFDTDWKDGVIDDTTVYKFTLYRINSKNKEVRSARTNINANKNLLIATFRYYYSLLEYLPQNYMVKISTTYKGMWEDTHILSFASEKVIKYRWKYDKH